MMYRIPLSRCLKSETQIWNAKGCSPLISKWVKKYSWFWVNGKVITTGLSSSPIGESATEQEKSLHQALQSSDELLPGNHDWYCWKGTKCKYQKKSSANSNIRKRTLLLGSLERGYMGCLVKAGRRTTNIAVENRPVNPWAWADRSGSAEDKDGYPDWEGRKLLHMLQGFSEQAWHPR